MIAQDDEYEPFSYKSVELEYNASTNNASPSACQSDGNISSGLKSLTLRESEAIHVIKQLEDQVTYL